VSLGALSDFSGLARRFGPFTFLCVMCHGHATSCRYALIFASRDYLPTGVLGRVVSLHRSASISHLLLSGPRRQ
jgi:hypothetical protein